MNKEETQAFEKCMKEIKRLLIEEKRTKQKLEEIHKAKLYVIRILLDKEYCEKLKGEENE